MREMSIYISPYPVILKLIALIIVTMVVMKMTYEVRDVVCDYGVYENGELKLILNSRWIVLEIVKLLEEDERIDNSVPAEVDGK